jgi:hypothetical protein
MASRDYSEEEISYTLDYPLTEVAEILGKAVPANE